MDAQGLVVGAALTAAVASAVSAWFAGRAIERAHAPLVWPSIDIHLGVPQPPHAVRVRLHNDGSGTAFNVRFAIGTPGDLDDVIALNDTSPIPAMREGAIVPPSAAANPEIVRDDHFHMAAPEDLRSDWYVVVRYEDSLSRRWEVRASADPNGFVSPRRLRCHWFQFWWPGESW